MTSGALSFGGLVGMALSKYHGYEPRFFQAYVSLFVVGLGSIMFHTTLMYKYQMADELPMSWGSLVWFYTIGNHYDKPGEQQYNWKPILLFGIANSLFFIFVTQEYPAIFQVRAKWTFIESTFDVETYIELRSGSY
ncbi:hypothetical protein SARC_10380 [Sphaeroforma arctica JP610]|uniref:Uncharacterized protein n=1 Tax=Sphaeroforma arctica JP610 TaxID=667725 RepID=A0A0L0FK71_9EUKA|nr:hypothetical protein SARC_10380 [Sphaeroforma arctica JP610]KNC77150.1 hypothetical protein SARC_10380 [Sphaeroforma arctica JP610]|eukprot:XP_014151052.1 hypothetical protein SARC_10380 [Sphaeroforma arctica JP610]